MKGKKSKMDKSHILGGILFVFLFLIIIAIRSDLKKDQGSDFKKMLDDYMLKL